MKRTISEGNETLSAEDMKRIAEDYVRLTPRRQFNKAMEKIERAASQGLFCAKFHESELSAYSHGKLVMQGFKMEHSSEKSDEDDDVYVNIIIARW